MGDPTVNNFPIFYPELQAIYGRTSGGLLRWIHHSHRVITTIHVIMKDTADLFLIMNANGYKRVTPNLGVKLQTSQRRAVVFAIAKRVICNRATKDLFGVDLPL